MDLITKITAPNPGVFTGGGTNTYLIGKDDITLVDPGPNISEHLDEIIKAGDGKIKRIFVTHTHKDHSPAALPLSKTLNVPMYGRLVDGESSWEDETFIPDIVLNDKDIIETDEYTLEVIHTPGHASNHLCFLIKELNSLIYGPGYSICETFIINLLEGRVDFETLILNDENYKDILLRNYQQLYGLTPKYIELQSEGPAHQRTFTMGVLNDKGEIIGKGNERSKKKAEQAASKQALEYLNIMH